MSWLITGGCGFIGTSLADHLLNRGDDVLLLDNLSRVGSSDNLSWLRQRHGPGWPFSQTDIRDGDAVSRCVAEFRPDVIAHLAGQVAMTTSLAHPRLDFEINAGGTLNVLEAARSLSPSPIVLYSSTNKVYGSLEHLRYDETETRYVLPDYPIGIDEHMPLDGSSPYGCSKLAGDQYVRDYSRIYGLRTAVFRHSSMYGGRQFATTDQGWIGWFCEQAIRAKCDRSHLFDIAGTGKQVRDALNSDDLVRLYVLAALKIDLIAGGVFNIGGGIHNSLSLVELFSRLEELVGTTLRYQRLSPRVSDQKVFIADVTTIATQLGWCPLVSVTTGLEAALQWTRERLSNC